MARIWPKRSAFVGIAVVSTERLTRMPASSSSVSFGKPMVRISVNGLSETWVPVSASAPMSAGVAWTAWTIWTSGPSKDSSPRRSRPQRRQSASRKHRSQCMVSGSPSPRAVCHSVS
jgi:hypothetical protein